MVCSCWCDGFVLVFFLSVGGVLGAWGVIGVQTSVLWVFVCVMCCDVRVMCVCMCVRTPESNRQIGRAAGRESV